jgi:hypothetical protein
MIEPINPIMARNIIKQILDHPYLAGLMKGTGCPVYVDLSKPEYTTSFAYSEIADYLIALGQAVHEYNET